MCQLLMSFAVISLAAGVLAACTAPWSYPPPQTSAVRPLASASPPPPARPARKPSPPRAVDVPTPEAGGEALAMTEPAPSLPVAGPTAPSPPHTPATDSSSPQTSELIGLDQPAVTRLLGATTEQFEQPPAVVWRYKNAVCELDLFFYLDLNSNRMRTLHYTVKGGGNDTPRRQDCVNSLRVAGSNEANSGAAPPARR